MKRGYLRIKSITIDEAEKYSVFVGMPQTFQYRKRDLWLGVFSSNTLVGVCCFSYSNTTGNIMHNFVTTRYRGRGALAKTLIRIKSFAADNSIDTIYSSVTPMALNSHLKAGAKIIAMYKNKNTKVVYENFY